MNWEFENAKKDLHEFWDYAQELYGPDGVLDDGDAVNLATLETAIGPELIKDLRMQWAKKIAAEYEAIPPEQSLGPNP